MAILEPFALAIGFLLSYVYDFTLSYGFAIAILTVIINVIIFPLTLRQTRSTKRMQDAQSDIKKLQKQYKDNKEELNKAMAAMYKEKGINPLGCILPLIIQMPIWFALFRVLREPLSFIPSTSVLFKDLELSTSLTFFNMDLQIPPSEVAGWVDRVPYLILILFVILTALYQQQQITKKTGKSDNPQAQQMQMVGKVMPIFFGFISWTLPTGLVVYFLTGNIFRIGQQALIVKLDDREEVKKEDKKEENNEDSQSNPIQENPRKNRKKKKEKIVANNKWVEVEARSIDDAIKAGLNELNLDDATQANINIIREPEGGVFGVGGTKALVRVSVRNGGSRNYSNKRRNNSRNNNSRKPNKDGYKKQYDSKKPRVEADKDEQLKVSIDFLKGLVKSIGLKGDVEGSLEDDNLVVKVTGEQTEALVGDKGFIIRSLHELTRTVVQRKTGAGTRLRLDVADYALKRKEALTIYAERLSKQIKEDKQEVMLEPMNSVDRKTLHDAAANFDGIKSYSEGREPYRSVVFAPEEEE